MKAAGLIPEVFFLEKDNNYLRYAYRFISGTGIESAKALRNGESLYEGDVVAGCGIGNLGGKGKNAYEEVSKAETFSLNSPASRHSYSKITQKSVAKNTNTIIMPGVDVSADVQAINAGKAIREGNNFTINGRTYGMHDGTLYPFSGEGFATLDRGGYKALGVYKNFGETPQEETILNNMGVSAETRSQALNVYKTAEGR